MAATDGMFLSPTVPVIDRGPYVAGRTLDLSYATKAALACADLCAVEMEIVDRPAGAPFGASSYAFNTR